MKTLFRLVALLVLLAGCASQKIPAGCPLPQKSEPSVPRNIVTTKTIYVDDRFDAGQKLAIVSAKNAWNQASKEIVKFDLVLDYKHDPEGPPPNKIVIIKLLSTDSATQEIDEIRGEPLVAATAKGPGTEVIVVVADRVKDTAEFKLLVMRELGHELGLPSFESSDHPAVMNEQNTSECLTQNDMKLFCAKFLCEWRDTNYCDSPSKKYTPSKPIGSKLPKGST
jgi:hypothetical protein